jgi:hypothetical protein
MSARKRYLPPDFCATVFADNLGQARHIAVDADGTVYVNTWRSPYKKDAKIPAGGFLVRLRDTQGNGVADSIVRFGEDSAGATRVGGTGLAIHDGHLYAEASGRIARYPLVPEADLSMLKPDACQERNRELHSPGIDPCPDFQPAPAFGDTTRAATSRCSTPVTFR